MQALSQPRCDFPKILAVHTGRARPFTRAGTFSAIRKSAIKGPMFVDSLGLQGDEQADKRVHGGLDKAVHAYPREHYSFWKTDLLQGNPLLEQTGAFGENLTTVGLMEADVCLGDRWRAGSVLLEVSQGRQPCWKLDDHFGVKGLCRQVQNTRFTGWYFRVIEAGYLQEGDVLQLENRPFPAWNVSRLLDLLWQPVADTAVLLEASRLPLPESWADTYLQRARGAPGKSASARVDGPEEGTHTT